MCCNLKLRFSIQNLLLHWVNFSPLVKPATEKSFCTRFRHPAAQHHLQWWKNPFIALQNKCHEMMSLTNTRVGRTAGFYPTTLWWEDMCMVVVLPDASHYRGWLFGSSHRHHWMWALPKWRVGSCRNVRFPPTMESNAFASHWQLVPLRSFATSITIIFTSPQTGGRKRPHHSGAFTTGDRERLSVWREWLQKSTLMFEQFNQTGDSFQCPDSDGAHTVNPQLIGSLTLNSSTAEVLHHTAQGTWSSTLLDSEEASTRPYLTDESSLHSHWIIKKIPKRIFVPYVSSLLNLQPLHCTSRHMRVHIESYEPLFVTQRSSWGVCSENSSGKLEIWSDHVSGGQNEIQHSNDKVKEQVSWWHMEALSLSLCSVTTEGVWLKPLLTYPDSTSVTPGTEQTIQALLYLWGASFHTMSPKKKQRQTGKQDKSASIYSLL